MQRLNVISGPAAGQFLDVERELVVGREHADWSIGDPEMSRRHLLVRPAEQGVVIEDLGSTNGTFVNGTRLTQPATVASGSTIRVGRTEIRVDHRPGGTVIEAAPQRRGTVRRLE